MTHPKAAVLAKLPCERLVDAGAAGLEMAVPGPAGGAGAGGSG